MLDDLQFRSCAYFFYSHTPTPEMCLWPSHMAKSTMHSVHPAASYYLLSTSFRLCSSDDPSQFQMTGKERREEKSVRKKRMVSEMKRGHAQCSVPLACVCSLTISSVLIPFSGTSCLLFLVLLNNLPNGLLLGLA